MKVSNLVIPFYTEMQNWILSFKPLNSVIKCKPIGAVGNIITFLPQDPKFIQQIDQALNICLTFFYEVDSIFHVLVYCLGGLEGSCLLNVNRR